MSTTNNCAFQFAKMSTGMFRNTEIVCDKTGLTLDEAKELWNTYYSDCAKHIHSGGECEMVIWINMVDKNSYGDHLEYISHDAESDGVRIWQTKKETFTSNFQIEQPCT